MSSNLTKDVEKAFNTAFSDNTQLGIESAESGNKIMKFPMMEVEVWAEHEVDIRFQIVPPEKRLGFVLSPDVQQREFPSLTTAQVTATNTFIGVQLERLIRREFKNRKVRASVHGWEYGERIARNCDIDQKGMTLFDVTIHKGYSAYHVVERLLQGFAYLDKVMRGEELPLES